MKEKTKQQIRIIDEVAAEGLATAICEGDTLTLTILHKRITQKLIERGVEISKRIEELEKPNKKIDPLTGTCPACGRWDCEHNVQEKEKNTKRRGG